MVLCDGDIGFENLAARREFPAGKAQGEAFGARGGVDEFGGRFAGDGPMELVLDGGKELLRQGCLRTVTLASYPMNYRVRLAGLCWPLCRLERRKMPRDAGSCKMRLTFKKPR